jgi:hypothetical protein
MWYTYSITDLVTFESDAAAIELEEDEARIFAARMAHDLVELLPDLTNKGMCVVVYDIDEHPVSVVPLDPIQ